MSKDELYQKGFDSGEVKAACQETEKALAGLVAFLTPEQVRQNEEEARAWKQPPGCF